MKHVIQIIALLLLQGSLSSSLLCAQQNGEKLLTGDDLPFLAQLTEAVMEASRIYPGDSVSAGFGQNQTGGTLIRPGGRDCYPAFWIRDYALSLESGFVSRQEQEHMLLLTASTQCDQTWITKNGSLVPLGAIADHIRIDDALPIYFPGTYSYEDQGTPEFGKVPPFGDQFLFIHMAWYFVKQFSDLSILDRQVNGRTLIDRLELAFRMVPADKHELVYTTEELRGIDFGFRDVQVITGKLCFPSVLKFRAARQLSELLVLSGYPDKALEYEAVASSIRHHLASVFMSENGWLLASTGRSAQPDVWSTALAVYYDVLSADASLRASQALADACHAGTISYKGNIRHIPTSGDYSEHSAWEISYAGKNTYQNGAYWGTPTGWVCAAISKVDPKAARQLAREYVDDLRITDFRQGPDYGGPYECFHPETGNLQNPVYLTTVSCPFAVFRESLAQK